METRTDTSERDSDRQRLWRRLNLFCTPPWAARAGCELIQMIDPPMLREGFVSDPCCGLGHIAGPAEEYFPGVGASDVYPYGFGLVADFLDPDWRFSVSLHGPEWIVMNPPFKLAPAFLRLGLARASRGVAMLCRCAFIEGVGRYPLMFGGVHPLTLFAPFSERVPMVMGRWDPKASSATAYAWFLWQKGAEPRPPHGIAPGTRKRLTHPGDIARWAISAGDGVKLSQGQLALPGAPPEAS